MAEGSGSNNTAIWVAVITVIGSLLTALIVNADKWITPRDKPAAVASPPAATSTPSKLAPFNSSPAPAPAEPSVLPRIASAAPATSARPETVPPPPSSDPADLNGAWRDDEGSRFSFEQTGSRYELTQTASNGTFQMMSRGTIKGRDLSQTFEMATGETGTCTARLNAAANKINGNCVYADGGWTFAIER